MTRRTLVTLAVVLGFVALLLYSTLSSQRATCTVVVEFGGRQNTATASAATEAEAEQQARTTACGTLAAGMNETIACGNRPPVQKTCQTR